MKYMVMECHLSYAVVLDEGGRFIKVANKNYDIGQMVTDVTEMQIPQEAEYSAKKRRLRWLYSAAAIAACLLLAFTAMFSMGRMTYASVYLTINPEVRIDVNRNDIVVGLEGTNEDGRTLIKDYSYEKKNLDLVMDELVDLAIDMGYLHEGGQITLTLDADNNEWVVTKGDALSTHLYEHLTEKFSVTIEITGTKEIINGITTPAETTGAVPDSQYREDNYGDIPQDGQSNYEDSSPEDDLLNNGDSDYESEDEDDDDDGDSDYEPEND